MLCLVEMSLDDSKGVVSCCRVEMRRDDLKRVVLCRDESMRFKACHVISR